MARCRRNMKIISLDCVKYKSPRPALCTCRVSVIVLQCSAVNYLFHEEKSGKFCSLLAACKSKTKRNSFNAWRLGGVFPRTQLRIHVLFTFCFSALMTVKFTRRKKTMKAAKIVNEARNFLCFVFSILFRFPHNDGMNQRSDPEPSK